MSNHGGQLGGFYSCNVEEGNIPDCNLPEHKETKNIKLMTGTKNPNNYPKHTEKNGPKDPPAPDIPPDRKFPEKPDWLPQDPPNNEPPEPKIPEVEPPPTEAPPHDPGSPPPFQE